jgi:tetratricopeptide (TPR) repeat protein
LELEPRTANNETLVVGWAYLQWGNLDRAEELLDEAYQDFEQDRNYLQAGGALTSLGELELQRGDTLKAQSLFRKAFSLMPNEANTVRAIVLTHIIQTSIWAGEMDSARIQLDRLNAQQASQPMPFSSTDGQCEVDYCNYLYWKKVGDKSAAQGYLEHALQDELLLNILPEGSRRRTEGARATPMPNTSTTSPSSSPTSKASPKHEREALAAGTGGRTEHLLQGLRPHHHRARHREDQDHRRCLHVRGRPARPKDHHTSGGRWRPWRCRRS